ncbi:MAG: hypothetical protein AABX10_04035 [Nanoarchaeota archaeon]
MKYKPNKKDNHSKRGDVARAQHELYEDESGITARKAMRDSITKPPITQQDADHYNAIQRSDYGIEKDIVKSDFERKEGDLSKATDRLYGVTLRLKQREKSEKDPENYQSSIKYESWIENRAKRLIKQATRAGDKETAGHAYNILKILDKEPHPNHGNLEERVSKEKRRRIVPPWMVSILIIGGLFFISPNITGNAISNMSQGNSNMIGAILIILGLMSAYFWTKS